MRERPRARSAPCLNERFCRLEAGRSPAKGTQRCAAFGSEMAGKPSFEILGVIAPDRLIADLADEARKPDLERRTPVGRIGSRLLDLPVPQDVGQIACL